MIEKVMCSKVNPINLKTNVGVLIGKCKAPRYSSIMTIEPEPRARQRGGSLTLSSPEKQCI